jgi:hypothetical protein
VEPGDAPRRAQLGGATGLAGEEALARREHVGAVGARDPGGVVRGALGAGVSPRGLRADLGELGRTDSDSG